MQNFKVVVKLHGDDELSTIISAETLGGAQKSIIPIHGSNLQQIGDLLVPAPNIKSVEFTEVSDKIYGDIQDLVNETLPKNFKAYEIKDGVTVGEKIRTTSDLKINAIMCLPKSTLHIVYTDTGVIGVTYGYLRKLMYYLSAKNTLDFTHFDATESIISMISE